MPIAIAIVVEQGSVILLCHRVVYNYILWLLTCCDEKLFMLWRKHINYCRLDYCMVAQPDGYTRLHNRAVTSGCTTWQR